MRLSAKERILIFLEEHLDEQLAASRRKATQPSHHKFTQAGIEEFVNISHRLVSRGLNALKREGLVKESRAYSRATGRHRGYYTLTSDGIIEAQRLKEELGGHTVAVRERDETKEMRLDALIAHLRELYMGSIAAGTSYVIYSASHDDAYKLFGELVRQGYEGLLITKTAPGTLEKEHGLVGAFDSYWLSELEGEDNLRPDDLETAATNIVSEFFTANERPLLFLEGFEYLARVNGFERCLRWFKNITDIVTKNDGVMLLPINPVLLDSTELEWLRTQDLKCYEPMHRPQEPINYTNILEHLSSEDHLDMGAMFEPKIYLDFSERSPEVENFVGRESEITQISEFIDSEIGVLVIRGIAGIGKSTLLSKISEQQRANMSIFWHRFYKFSTLRGMLTKLSEFLAKLGRERLKNYLSAGKLEPEELIMLLEDELATVDALLVFDNFEHANAEIVAFFSSLKELRLRSKLVVLGRSVQSFYDRRDVVVKKRVLEMQLDSLSKADSQELLKHRGFERHIDRFYALTRGHPLLLKLMIPETAVEAEEFLKAEIVKRLDDDEKCAVELASIFRFPFYPRALFVDDIDYDTIDRLVEKSFIQRASNVYELYELLKDFIYNRLTATQRTEYHTMAAEYYVKESGSTALVETMYHLMNAGARDKTVELAVENGSAIIRSGYVEEFMRILTGLPDDAIQPAHNAKLLFFKGDISNLQGKWDEALRYYQRSLHLSTALQDAISMAEAYRGVAKIYFPRAEYEKALAQLVQALNLSEEINDVHGIADAHYNIGSIRLRRGELQAAQKALDLCLEYCQKIGDMPLMARAYRAMGVMQWSMGAYDESITLMRKSIEACSKIGDPHEMATLYNNMGAAYDCKGELDEAIEWYEECVKLSNELGDVRMQGYGLSNAAECYIKKRHLDKAMEYTDKALRILVRLDEKRAITQCQLNYGMIYRDRKEWAKATASFEKAIKMAKKMEDLEFPSQIYFEYGKMYKVQGEHARATGYFEDAIAAYEQLGNKAKADEVRRELAR